MRVGSKNDVKEQVLGLVKSLMAENAIVKDVLPDSPLADIGLTSIDMVNLMLAVEAEFDMMIPQVDITPENFRTIEAIEQLVIKLGRVDGATMANAEVTASVGM